MKKQKSTEPYTIRELGRILSGAYYDYQQTRMSSMNRVRDLVRKRAENIPFDKPEIKKKKRTYDKKYSDKTLKKTIDELREKGKISEDEYEYLRKTLDLMEKSQKLENEYKPALMSYISNEEIWKVFLSKVRGLGPVLSANLLKEFGYCDIVYTEDVLDKNGEIRHKKGDERFPMVSSLWRYCGLDVIEGKAPRKRRGERITFNPNARTLLWKIGDSFIKQRSPIYRDIYDTKKKKELRRRDKNKPQNKLHAHLRAMRRMVKIFLEHYWVCARTIKGLNIREPYVFDELGHTHKITYIDVISANENI